MSRSRPFLQASLSVSRALICLALSIQSGLISARAGLVGNREGRQTDGADRSLKYRFENPRFYIPLIEVEVGPGTDGLLRFKRGESDDIIERRLTILPGTLLRLGVLVDRVNFLHSNEQYQSKKDFSHLGWMTISVKHGELERTVRFNYTTNDSMVELAEIFRALATQEMDLFDIELALRHQPLDTPRLLEALESNLRLERIAEPERLLAILREIANDDTLPLIARNHANRIISGIQKRKFRTPVKVEK